MIRQRLYLQIYLTILAALALTVLVTSVVFSGFDHERRPSVTAITLAQHAVAEALTARPAPIGPPGDTLARIAKDLPIELALFDATGILIASYPNDPQTEWIFNQQDVNTPLLLADGRVVQARLSFPEFMGGFGFLLLILAATAFAIGIAAYPLVRRLTGRLERLQRVVERIGTRDLTPRAQIEGRDEIAALAHSFNSAADRIETLIAAHLALLANASHELRTPLSRIRVGLEMYNTQGDRRRLSGIEADIQQLDVLIDEILTLSRLDAAPIEMEADIDLLGLVAEECAHLGVEVEGNAATIRGNREMLRRLVRNLVTNAERHGAPPISVRVASSKRGAVLSVRDEGTGIKVEDRERVFERFYRGAGKQNVDGYGLGLPLVRQIAEAHGGRVAVSTSEISEIVVTF